MTADRYVPTREGRFSLAELGGLGVAVKRLDQLALEHLYGVRT